MNRLRTILALALVIPFALGCGKVSKDTYVQLKIMAPDHLQGILEKAAAQFHEENNIKVTIVYEKGEDIIGKVKDSADIDAFITYNSGRFERILKDLVIHSQYSCPFRLSLVLAGPTGGQLAKLKSIKEDFIRRVVIVDPEAGYEGQLAKEILEKTRLWDKLQPKLILAESNRHLLTYLATGEADVAIMLESSLDEKSRSVIYQRLDEPLTKYMLHCAAVTAESKQKESARAFIDLLDSKLCGIYNIKGVYQNNDE